MYNDEGMRAKYTKCQDYKKVFSSPEGEIVLFDLMKQSHFLKSTYVPGDTNAMMITEGMRNLLLYILWQIEMDPKDILEKIRVQKEQDDKDKENIYVNVD